MSLRPRPASTSKDSNAAGNAGNTPNTNPTNTNRNSTNSKSTTKRNSSKDSEAGWPRTTTTNTTTTLRKSDGLEASLNRPGSLMPPNWEDSGNWWQDDDNAWQDHDNAWLEHYDGQYQEGQYGGDNFDDTARNSSSSSSNPRNSSSSSSSPFQPPGRSSQGRSSGGSSQGIGTSQAPIPQASSAFPERLSNKITVNPHLNPHLVSSTPASVTSAGYSTSARTPGARTSGVFSAGYRNDSKNNNNNNNNIHPTNKEAPRGSNTHEAMALAKIRTRMHSHEQVLIQREKEIAKREEHISQRENAMRGFADWKQKNINLDFQEKEKIIGKDLELLKSEETRIERLKIGAGILTKTRADIIVKYFAERVNPKIHDAAEKKEGFGMWKEEFVHSKYSKIKNKRSDST
jgi:hypothetical protein